jgi:tetratricopeptide (TPR) repeat protein
MQAAQSPPTPAPVLVPLLDRLGTGLSAHRAGRLDEAEAVYRASLAQAPDHGMALHLLGLVQLASGRFAVAVATLRHALVQRPEASATRVALADATAALGELEPAMALYRAVLLEEPDHVGALGNLAHALCRSGDPAAAIALCRHALTIAPDLAPLHATLGMALLQARQPAAALRAATYATDHGPRSAEAWCVRGLALSALGQPERATQALGVAVDLDPDHAAAHLALGNAWIDQDHLALGETHLRRAVALDPYLPEAHASLGFLLTVTGELAAAVAACDRAIALRRDFPHAYWNKSVAQLLAGDFAAGWRSYEWRKQHNDFARDFASLPGREWRGSTLEGHVLLVRAEQGLGDTIQLARYVPLLVARGGAVILACAPALIGLLSRLPGVSAVVACHEPLPPYDLWVDMMSLPGLFATRPDRIPSSAGYLRPEPARQLGWPAPPPGRPAVGIVWAGNPAHHNDRRRSLPPAALAALLAVPDIGWISLQVGPRSGECVPHDVADLSSRLIDFDETAALIGTLDLVIAVDTATAHLAGALGCPVWLMLPHAPDWRWMLGRADSPWYDSFTLFRQPSPGDWRDVTDRIAARLAGWRIGRSARRGVIALPTAREIAGDQRAHGAPDAADHHAPDQVDHGDGHGKATHGREVGEVIGGIAHQAERRPGP